MTKKRFGFWQPLLCIGLIVVLATGMCRFSARCERIRTSVLRLHILANSDSDEDQALKLQVRDRLLEESAELFESVQNETEAADAARAHIGLLQDIAEAEIEQCGYAYPVTIEVGPAHFDTRNYEDVTLPAGDYTAVRVLIGEAAGKNWWCVMFPAMCLPAASEQKELSEVLNDEELDIVSNRPQYEVRFKIVEVYESLKNRLKKQ